MSVVEPLQRIIARQRLDIEDIERGAMCLFFSGASSAASSILLHS